MVELTEAEWRFLDALRAGESANAYARRSHYSHDWAKWVSRRIREKLSVPTIREAITLTDISREDFDALKTELRELKEAQAELVAAQKSGSKRRIADARDDVAEAREDLDGELKSRGLTRRDLDQLAEEKEFERFRARQERLEAERAAATNGKPPAGDPDADDPDPDADDDPDADAPDDQKPPPEEPPASQHRFDKPLWGRTKGGE